MRRFLVGTLLALPLAALAIPQKASADIIVSPVAPATRIAQVNFGIGIWIPGYWGYDRSRRYWVPGRYDRGRYWDRNQYNSRYWYRDRDRNWDRDHDRRWDRDNDRRWDRDNDRHWDRDNDRHWDRDNDRHWDRDTNGHQNGNRDR